MAYVLIIAGNILIISLYSTSQGLHIPMYFFLCNLAIADIISTNVILPVLLVVVTKHTYKLCVAGCLAQCYLYFFAGAAQFFLLDVMCYDRYLAVCYPLRYSIIMHKKNCIVFASGAWISSFLINLSPSIFIMTQSFCFSQINHFFCDVGPLLQNFCNVTNSSLQVLLLLNSGLLFFSLMVVVISYGHIIIAICKLHSSEGRKVVSTCLSHALVVTLFFGSYIFMYVKPFHSQDVNDYDKKVAVLSTIAVPLINPYIYTLRNQTIRDIVKGNKRLIAVMS
uniref:G-protein coupled receptors family 1 profile domain-containing protein n=1 Tax=Pyxicephalus adspersus TaxID=30357 RepID=A0AAV3ABQ5_PYXAD|nr:TPA: hypothetical protein GDO54_013896 [Pyxicephalus adspersus]